MPIKRSAVVAVLLLCLIGGAGVISALYAQALQIVPPQLTSEPAAKTDTAATPTAALAPLDIPRGRVLLTVTGAIATGNGSAPQGGRAARFDAAMLNALPRNGFATSTIWTSGVMQFDGVDLQALADRLGVTRGVLRVRALNDYAVDIPVAELGPSSPLLADRRDGQMMTIREKGPLWLVYPYDQGPDYRNEIVYSRSVWQVDRIEVLP
ncbi:oxidoreductase [Rhodobacter sp. TJ_12]|uniref:oxidoreductase n=1 Tax=Rhodobacter sp. TJ_12 TaxID=2029399 RepID=UPI001CBCF204|nr:oxidoreductase [Rhodobacter sp. TJ_12]